MQDQAITIVTELCETSKLKLLEPEIQHLCVLLLQIAEKALYLELCVSQTCGIRPVLGRVEDFSKEIKELIQGTHVISNNFHSLFFNFICLVINVLVISSLYYLTLLSSLCYQLQRSMHA